MPNSDPLRATTSANPTLPIRNRAELIGAIVETERVGSIGSAHLLRALAAGRIAMLPIIASTSSSKFKKFAALAHNRPAVSLIGDDDHRDRGPAGWPLAARVLTWARFVMLHGAGAKVEHYELAVQAAQDVGRVLIVECSATTLPAWVDLARNAPHRPATLVVAPSDGAHPIVPPRSAMQ